LYGRLTLAWVVAQGLNQGVAYGVAQAILNVSSVVLVVVMVLIMDRILRKYSGSSAEIRDYLGMRRL
jgi:hypothetical protein